MSLAVVMPTGPITGVSDLRLLRDERAVARLKAGNADVIGSCVAEKFGSRSLQKKDVLALHSFFEGDFIIFSVFLSSVLFSSFNFWLVSAAERD